MVMDAQAARAALDSLPAQGRLLGLDLGEKTIGLALCDAGRRIASPLETIRRSKFTADAQRLAEIAASHRVVGLVIGLPLNMDGSEGPRAQATRAFVRNLAPRLPLPVMLWDERMSTLAVERMMIAADTSRARRKEAVDKLAAAYILQAALDAMDRAASTDETPSDFRDRDPATS